MPPVVARSSLPVYPEDERCPAGARRWHSWRSQPHRTTFPSHLSTEQKRRCVTSAAVTLHIEKRPRHTEAALLIITLEVIILKVVSWNHAQQQKRTRILRDDITEFVSDLQALMISRHSSHRCSYFLFLSVGWVYKIYFQIKKVMIT